MIDLHLFASNLEQGTDGLWHPKVRTRPTYPDEGNAFCFQVEDQSFWFQHRNWCVLAAVARLPPAGPVFDIGGGNGFVARALAQAGYPAVVVEPGPVGARNAQARGLSPVICSTLDDAGFHPGSLPAAGLFDVLEHIEDDHTVLRRLAAFVQPGGRLYLTVPAYSWLWSGEDELGGHHRRYSRGALVRVVRGAGFGVEFASYFFGRCRRRSRCCACCRRAWGCARRPTRPPSRRSFSRPTASPYACCRACWPARPAGSPAVARCPSVAAA